MHNGKILNITNGDCAVDIMRQASLAGDFLPWRDVLHEGPVPENLSLAELSKIRSRFISDSGWGEPDSIETSFADRDKVLYSHGEYDHVILWFEHDLYDQLQLLQLLDWFNAHKDKNTRLSLICVDQYLGMLSPQAMKDLLNLQQTVSADQLTLASHAWAAFRSADPRLWFELLNADTEALPFLSGAVLRMLEEYPAALNGLSRTAQQTLLIINESQYNPMQVFGRYQQTEQRRFLGDVVFWGILDEFIHCDPPLIELQGNQAWSLPPCADQILLITEGGLAVLQGRRDWLDLANYNRWLGGVHLTADNIWRWDSNAMCLISS